MSLAMVGGLHLNNDGIDRLFEMALCWSGEPVRHAREPSNPVDPNAVAVFSVRGTQFGYLSAECSGWIGARISQGEDIREIFQQASSGVAVIRVSFSGDHPSLPEMRSTPVPPRIGDEDAFYPDDFPVDDWA